VGVEIGKGIKYDIEIAVYVKRMKGRECAEDI
jgi:hypothetical protein